MGFVNRRELSHDIRMVWHGVLRRAVYDYVLFKGKRAHSLEWKRAFRYLFTENERPEAGLSLEEACDIFGWDVDYFRRLVTRLTREDIKKMETSQYREDFVFDLVEVVLEQTEKWKTANCAAPFLPLYHYSPEYRERLRPKVVRRKTLNWTPKLRMRAAI